MSHLVMLNIYNYEIYGHYNSFNGIRHRWMKDSRIGERLIVTTLLNNEHQFIKNLHTMNSGS